MKKILSIDDSRVIHSFIEESFEGSFEVIHAYTGLEGIGALKNNPDISLVLLDWEMPGLTGPETLLAIRDLGIKVPVIMVTSRMSPNGISEVLMLGASDYIVKPFSQEFIVSKVNEVLGLTSPEEVSALASK